MNINLSFADFAAITAVIVTLQALAIGLIVVIINKRSHHSKEECYQNNHTHKETRHSLDAITDVFIELGRIVQGHTGLIRFISQEAGAKSKLPNLPQVNSARIRRLKKAMQELMLMGENEIRRISAIQQLSQTLGDVQTLNIMCTVSRYFTEDEYLKKGIQELSERLNCKA